MKHICLTIGAIAILVMVAASMVGLTVSLSQGHVYHSIIFAMMASMVAMVAWEFSKALREFD